MIPFTIIFPLIKVPALVMLLASGNHWLLNEVILFLDPNLNNHLSTNISIPGEVSFMLFLRSTLAFFTITVLFLYLFSSPTRSIVSVHRLSHSIHIVVSPLSMILAVLKYVSPFNIFMVFPLHNSSAFLFA